eukprot:TRINITY_DN886_c0_g2_i1.p1 TRINITY_DN886_c0_g2~~TRINITY_DN886_c0_g2_i1.p1  ORF type:complete len:694 (+),score=271.33 TRINITY_DN886_c0_g2_i1:152-2233(+)
MGCGASSDSPSKGEAKGTTYNVNVDNPGGQQEEKTKPTAGKAPEEEPAKSKSPAPTPDPATPTQDANEAVLPFREKNVPMPLLAEMQCDGKKYLLSHYAHQPGLHGVTFALRETDTETIYTYITTDKDFINIKEEQVSALSWNVFWRALGGTFTKNDDSFALIIEGDKVDLELTLRTNKDPKPHPLRLPMTKTASNPIDTYTHFIGPFIQYYTKRKDGKGQEEVKEGKKEKFMKEEAAEKIEWKLNEHESKWQYLASLKDTTGREKLREDARQSRDEYSSVQGRLDKVAKQINQLKNGKGMHPLDGLYSVGGARSFQHTEYSIPYVPKDKGPELGWLRLLEDGRIEEATEENTACLSRPPTDPEVEELVNALPDDKVWQFIECCEKIDTWNYDCFQVDQITEGRTLLYTVWALLQKYGLTKHYKLDRTILADFLSAVQAGYLPNQYHNSMHAADVVQITHFCLGPGGMRERCNLSNEDCFAAIMAAAIHDYNHPGLNNNFHTKVGAYLGTLYNDRSILENHHCSCVFEMMNHQKYDILQFMTDEQKKEIRDTMTEMLLATDMGNHAKIFSAFRRRMQDRPDWGKKKDDVRLVLIMAIKLADISNCSRPTELYLKWANRIAEEFYLQGDAEVKSGVPISPFMDRRKHDTDFHKGQVSFINYIVYPLFDAVGEVFPKLKFTLQLCNANRDHWKNQ